MVGSIDRLAELLGVADVHVERGIRWDLSREECGVAFPSDYRRFIDAFGGGAIGGEFGILAPLEGGDAWSTGGFVRMMAYVSNISDAFRGMRTEFPRDFHYPIFPELGGILAWAGNMNGDQCFWDTSSPDPDHWKVVVWFRGRRSGRAWEETGLSTVDFLYRIISDPTFGPSSLLLAAEGRMEWMPD